MTKSWGWSSQEENRCPSPRDSRGLPRPSHHTEGGHSTKPAASEPDTESASALNVNSGLRDFKQHVVVVHEHQPLVL